MGRVIIVSNRVSDPRKAAQAGGVAVALADVVGRRKGIWAGWDGRVQAVLSAPRVTKARRREGGTVTSSLTPEEHLGFYLGYSNSVLWPVFHNRLDLAQFEAGYFRIYSDVNARFAAMIAPLIQPDDLIWVHDYQFIPLGLELRRLGIENPIGFFLHIPFPPSQCVRAIPEHKELARALASYDLLGLQTSDDVAHILDYLQQGVGGRLLNNGQIRAFDRILQVESFPIGISPSDFESPTAGSVLVQGRRGAKRMIGIDRLDYSKGLPQKFRAFGRFLDLAPQYCRKVVLTQIAPPTRESVDAYAEIRKELEALSGSINGRFGELDWVPIHYIHRPVQRSRLADIYRSSQVGLVTPLRDGMNLVAKEYVAAQDSDDPGVLVLSQFAGAAEELDQALIVNPYNIDETARAMIAAVEMPLDERRARHAGLLAKIRANDVATWAERFISSLLRVGHQSRQPFSPAFAGRFEAALGKLKQLSEVRVVDIRKPRKLRNAIVRVSSGSSGL